MSRTRSVALGAAAGISLAALSLGCGGGGGGGGGGSGDGPFGLEVRVPVTTLEFPLAVPSSDSVNAVDAIPLLQSTFEAPVYVTAAPGDPTRLFIVEQRGRIRMVTGYPGTTASPPQVSTFLDITSRVTGDMGEEGLLGLAFDPAYATNRELYVSYVANSPRRSVVARYKRSAANVNVADTAETILFTVNQPFPNHNGGSLAFGPDGFLYGSLGDGGDGGDPFGNGQSKTTLLGKVFRVDVHGTAGALPYAIPADNPFAAAAGSERKEIYAWGFRNPWRLAFDRVNGALWVGDVGQETREEIDLVRRGGNYGWRAMEGKDTYASGDLGLGPFDDPMHDYGRGEGSCVIGGYPYRGSSVPSLYGAYVYSDNGSRRLWALTSDGNVATSNVQIGGLPSVSSFGEDPSGELLICDYDHGKILKLAPKSSAPGGTFPATLSATGIYQSLSTLTPAPGILPYDVNAPLWSDGAEKHRLLALPGVERIDWSENGAWSFPPGTCLVKTFSLPLTKGVPSSAVKVETRVLLLSTTGWEGYTYRWRDDQSDADLLTGADARSFTIADSSAPGGQYSQTWTFPSRSDCLRCHTAPAGRVLGLSTRQINRDFDYAGVGGIVDNQLRTWAHLGLFSGSIPSPSSLPAHPDPSDVNAAVAPRARAYLDANCAMCHRLAGSTGTPLDLRSTISVAAMHAVGQAPQDGFLGLPNPFIVQSGDKANSVLWLRLSLLDTHRMPPLASSRVDDAGVTLVGRWIDDGP